MTSAGAASLQEDIGTQGGAVMNPETTSRVQAVRTVGIPVTDQDRALDFYVGTLGLEKRMDAAVPQLGGRWIEVAPAGSSTSRALVPARDDLRARVETGARPATRQAPDFPRHLPGQGVDFCSPLPRAGAP